MANETALTATTREYWGGRRRNMAQPALGTGERFAALKGKLAGRGGVTNPGALAAWIGRKKYGAKGFAGLSARGRKRRKGGAGYHLMKAEK